jgi:4-amino-4-deoxy-L-arabinose transferase-like glycosyltransferase
MPNQIETSAATQPSIHPLVPAPSAARLCAFVAVVAVALFLIRVSAPPDLADDYHQERQAAYVLDALENGHWICQRDVYGDIASKPPLYTWLAAAAARPFAHANWFSLVLPAALSTTALALIILMAGRRYFGWAAGFLGALAYLLSTVGIKQTALARIDGLFALTVTVTALLAFRAWQTGRGWLWVWLAAAAGTLAKGPLVILLAGGGLLAALWEKRTHRPAPLRGSHLAGMILFAAITGGWVAVAYAQFGQPLIDKMLGKELIGHALQERGGQFPGQQFYLPTTYFLTRFAPWSLMACLGLWRICRTPSPDDQTRRFERFLFALFFAGVLIFSVAAHQRPDLIFPLIPCAALLAGRELARWPARPALLLTIASVASVLVLAGVAFQYHSARNQKAPVVRTRGMARMAGTVGEQVGAAFPLSHLDDPFAFQFYLHTMRPYVSFDRAAQALRSDAPVFVAVSDLPRLQKLLAGGSPLLHVLAQWSANEKDRLYIVSNHPRLEKTDRTALLLGSLTIRMEGVELVSVRANDFCFRVQTNPAAVVFSGDGSDPGLVRAQILDHGRISSQQSHLLKKGERWELNLGP